MSVPLGTTALCRYSDVVILSHEPYTPARELHNHTMSARLVTIAPGEIHNRHTNALWVTCARETTPTLPYAHQVSYYLCRLRPYCVIVSCCCQEHTRMPPPRVSARSVSLVITATRATPHLASVPDTPTTPRTGVKVRTTASHVRVEPSALRPPSLMLLATRVLQVVYIAKGNIAVGDGCCQVGTAQKEQVRGQLAQLDIIEIKPVADDWMTAPSVRKVPRLSTFTPQFCPNSASDI